MGKGNGKIQLQAAKLTIKSNFIHLVNFRIGKIKYITNQLNAKFGLNFKNITVNLIPLIINKIQINSNRRNLILI